MRPRLRAMPLLALWLSIVIPSRAGIERQGGTWIVTGGSCAVHLDARDGRLLAVKRSGWPGAIWKSGEFGAWRVRFSDGAFLSAADFPAATNWTVACLPDDAAGSVDFHFQCPELDLRTSVRARGEGVEFTAEVRSARKTVHDLEWPARLRFDPQDVQRFVFPARGNMSVGLSFRSTFFARQSPGHPGGWTFRQAGPEPFRQLTGSRLVLRPMDDPPVPLRVTALGREWLGAAAATVEGRPAVVNRADAKPDGLQILVDSANGPFLTAQDLGGGGAGRLWRFGGSHLEDTIERDAGMVAAVVARIAQTAQPPRQRIGVLQLNGSPVGGAWTRIPVAAWSNALARRAVPCTPIATVADLERALQSGAFAALLNPYGEGLPVAEPADLGRMVDAIGNYVRAGGNWFETGGHPFHAALVPQPFLDYGGPRPNLFADFAHLESRHGSVSLFGVQPRPAEPWTGATNPAALFVPGHLACGGDAAGGYHDRAFAAHIPPGTSWRPPAVRMLAGDSPEAALAAYAAAHALGPRLAAKLDPGVHAKLRQSVLVYLGGTARQKIDTLDAIPAPALIHFADYLKGGFDKEYPDHLPPNARFGSADDLRELLAACTARGHLAMPYTNPTWWCDHPRGPTFLREGDAPLLRRADGQPAREDYSGNDGYTVTHWHPAVQAANRRTMRQFSEEFPVDIVFQDQLGARSWTRDFNPASPSPTAYSDGLAAQGLEDSRVRPLATEDGNDLVIGCEALFCGMTWGLVPFEHPPAWRRLLRDEFPPGTWDIYPLAQRLAADKVAFYHHDLGAFVTTREVLAWTLALGYGMSYRVSPGPGFTEEKREWLKWLDRVQKSIAAHAVGEPLGAFEHIRPPAGGSGIVAAHHGPIAIVANLDPAATAHRGDTLPPFGFRARSRQGLLAGDIPTATGVASFVAESTGGRLQLWCYARAGEELAVPLPPGHPDGAISLATATGDPHPAAIGSGTLRLRLPDLAGRKPIQRLWHFLQPPP